MKKAIFIAHGGTEIGMGHVIRCLSLAEQFRNNKYCVEFISKYEIGQNMILSRDFTLLPLKNKGTHNKNDFSFGTLEEMISDLAVIVGILLHERPDVVVVDNYNVNEIFFTTIKKYTKCLVYIDDNYVFDYPVDILVNGNISGEMFQYKKTSSTEKLLTGLKYNLIRDEFLYVTKKITKKKITDIMITTGAADPKNISEFIINAIIADSKLSYCQLNVVSGNAFIKENVSKLKELSKKYSNVVIYENPKSMKAIMDKSDIAITAGGSTMYEVFACQLPTIAFIYADNQTKIVEAARQRGYLISAGHYDSLVAKDLAKQVSDLADDYNLRKEMSIKTKNAVDCQGTKRVVEEVNEWLFKN